MDAQASPATVSPFADPPPSDLLVAAYLKQRLGFAERAREVQVRASELAAALEHVASTEADIVRAATALDDAVNAAGGAAVMLGSLISSKGMA